MRATAVARVPVLLLLPLLVVLAGTNFRFFVEGGVEGDVGTDGIDLCVDGSLEDQELLVDPDLEMELVDTCVRMSLCTGVGVDSMTQRVCAPID